MVSWMGFLRNNFARRCKCLPQKMHEAFLGIEGIHTTEILNLNLRFVFFGGNLHLAFDLFDRGSVDSAWPSDPWIFFFKSMEVERLLFWRQATHLFEGPIFH